MKKLRILTFLAAIVICVPAKSQHSVARKWSEVLLEAIRHDFARPTVHARNLFHTSAAMWDAWAAYDASASTYFLGRTNDGYLISFGGVSTPADIQAAREEAISFAAYRLLSHRFANSPGVVNSQMRFDTLMVGLGYDTSYTSTNYTNDTSAALGNYIAEQIINFGLQDNSNEQNDYINSFYSPINAPLITKADGNPSITDLNRWQPLALDIFIDQSGNEFPVNVPDFLSPEWGQVSAFALDPADRTSESRGGFDYWVYHDPGPPPTINTDSGWGLADYYKWNFALVSTWSAHLDTTDGVMWDISPASIGNVLSYPTDEAGMRAFYDLQNGGDPGNGYTVNPSTGLPYTPQMVRRGDYARVLAEFWADGPDSETPPGHWYTLMNYVSDHDSTIKRFKGTGPVLDDLEWDVKAYFALGGGMHDAAITAWGCKGRYDYLRPISAIRYMGDQGQSSDSTEPSFTFHGLPLIDTLIQVVKSGDTLAGPGDVNVGKMKVYAWRGPDFIGDPATDMAGVDWILSEDWWPYQRPTFVTPNFAGYVSGHSTYSAAAAEILSMFTGDEYFPGGMGEFIAKKDSFLVFEEGPSTDVVLQWAKYKDASDQCSLSRIWGGIHPPIDDIPGRLMGEELGIDAFDFAETFFNGSVITDVSNSTETIDVNLYPVPAQKNQPLIISLPGPVHSFELSLYNIHGSLITKKSSGDSFSSNQIELLLAGVQSGIYLVKINTNIGSVVKRIVVLD